MVSLRFRPEWFKARSQLGYGADWPLDWREMWDWYRRAELALSISGPITYPWGPKRPRYPYRAHPINGAAELLARGAEAMGYAWTETPLATVSAPKGQSPPCVYRGFCRFGCSTNAKQSQLVTFLPRALAAGAEIRDLAMVGRIEMGRDGRATGVHYHREGRWRFQTGAGRGRRGLRHRNAAPASELGDRPISARAREQQRPRRPDIS